MTIELANDIAVVISGKLSIYRKKSYYQLQVRTMVYDDEAIYHNEFLRLKNKYEKLGYFDPGRKIKTLPKLKKNWPRSFQSLGCLWGFYEDTEL